MWEGSLHNIHIVTTGVLTLILAAVSYFAYHNALSLVRVLQLVQSYLE
jgi:hypothetical protein